ncbi:MAG: fatty acid desaturase family protein [Chitinophagales bacterium]
MEENHLPWYQQQLKQYFSKEELAALMHRSDWRGLLEVAYTWVWIIAALLLAGVFPHPATVFLALFILGGKQLACAIIMHDCSHDALFKSRKLNAFFGNWLGAFPIIQNLEQYRPYHREHHIHTGLDSDPDLALTKGYPASEISLSRKFLRDLLGATGVKAMVGTLAMHLGIWEYNLAGVVQRSSHISPSGVWQHAWTNLRGPIAFHTLFFLTLWLCGAAWLYAIWWIAFLTTYNFCLRVRSIAEHSMAENRLDPQQNTRTTYANFVERMLFAPHYVNYHNEHHLCMGAPPYSLPKMHQLLLARGYYQNSMMEPNYRRVLLRAIKKTV